MLRSHDLWIVHFNSIAVGEDGVRVPARPGAHPRVAITYLCNLGTIVIIKKPATGLANYQVTSPSIMDVFAHAEYNS